MMRRKTSALYAVS